MSHSDVCDDVKERGPSIRVVLSLLELQKLAEALSVLADDLPAGGLSQQLVRE